MPKTQREERPADMRNVAGFQLQGRPGEAYFLTRSKITVTRKEHR